VTGFVAGCAAGAALEVKFGLWALTLPWRNDPWIISRGIIKKTISASEHEEWFRRVLEGKESRMYIICEGADEIGQIRFQRGQDRDWTISVYLLKDRTGRGLGVAAIEEGCCRVRQEFPDCRILAVTLVDNANSQSAFRKAGFRECDEKDKVSLPENCRVFLLAR
jgi:RimJ/RimL family protein N-acetyltransferase